jgi:hypothetical protein
MRNARRAAGTAMLVGGLVSVMVTGAFGAGDTVKTTVKLSPAHPKPSKNKAAEVKLSYAMTFTGPGGARPANLASNDLLLPPGMTADGAGFASCAMSTLEANDVNSCPANSVVGHAGGDINVQPIQDATMATDGVIYATKAKAGKPPELAVFYTVRDIPSAHAIAPIKFVKSGQRWKLHLTMPDLPTAPGLPNATPVDASFTFDAKGSKGLVIRTTKACPKGLSLPNKVKFHDGSSANSPAKAC